jgi:DNA-binding HxlR family transcriptional regulator
LYNLSMPMNRGYADQHCSLARSLEVVGERWTLLIVRDAFYGVRRFADFVSHLSIPRAVLSDRLGRLVAARALTRAGTASRPEYELTEKGVALWPLIYSAIMWGDEHYAPRGPRRLFRHAEDGGRIDKLGRCETCSELVPPDQIEIGPGPGHSPKLDTDSVSIALREPHRLLEPLDLSSPRHTATASRPRAAKTSGRVRATP